MTVTINIVGLFINCDTTNRKEEKLMTTPQTFVRKHTTSFLPIKYVRMSVHSLIHRDHTDHLPDTGMGDFIETPVHYHREQ